MIPKEEIHASIHEATLEEEALLKRSSAPTLRDLRAAAQDLFTNFEAEVEPNPTSPNDRQPQQAA